MNHLLASLSIHREYNVQYDTMVCVDAEGAVWETNHGPMMFYPRSVPLGTTPVALASGKLIGWACFVLKDHQYVSVAPMLKLAGVPVVVRLEIRRDRAGNPTLIAPSRAAVTDVRDIVLFRDPPALKTSAQMYGLPVWFELTTEKFFMSDPDGKHRSNIPRDVIEHYLMMGANYGQHRNAPAPLHGGAAQSAGYGTGASSAQIANTAQAAIAAQQAQAGASIKYWPVQEYSLPQPKLPRVDPVVGEVVAWRAWCVSNVYKGYELLKDIRLTSIYQCAVVWNPEEPLKSALPTDYGDIGIHAHKTRETLLKYVGEAYSTKMLVIGRVRLWGEVVEGETGYRAEFAQVESLEEIRRPTAFIGWSEVDWDGNPRHVSPTEESINDQQLLEKLREVYGV